MLVSVLRIHYSEQLFMCVCLRYSVETVKVNARQESNFLMNFPKKFDVQYNILT